MVFVLLSLSKETQAKRLQERHGDDEAGKLIVEMCLKIGEAYQMKQPDELNTFDVIVSEDMTPEEVVKVVLEKVK